jgi:TonB family protein
MNTFFVRSLILFVIVTGLISVNASAQVEEVTGTRKVVTHVSPAYPPLARTMSLTGSVRLTVVVEPSGSVKSVQQRGGSPLFIQAAESAVRSWKWEKAERESIESVEVRFHQ